MAKFVKIANLYLCVIIATLVACNHRSSEEKYIEIADSKKKAESISATETSVPKPVIVEIEPAMQRLTITVINSVLGFVYQSMRRRFASMAMTVLHITLVKSNGCNNIFERI